MSTYFALCERPNDSRVEHAEKFRQSSRQLIITPFLVTHLLLLHYSTDHVPQPKSRRPVWEIILTALAIMADTRRTEYG